MKSYIHLYKTNEEFTASYNGPDYVEPWLSLTEGNMEVNYNKPKLTAITFDSITWVTDIPATGGTATKDNCEFKVYAKYDNGISVDISSDATVTGELVVPSSTEGQRHKAGQLTLTASYSGLTATGNVTVYQEAVDFSTKPLTFNILSAGTINWAASDSSLTKTIEYKLNDSNNWTSITSNTGESTPTITVKAGDKIQFRGDNTAYCGDNPELYSTFGGSTAEFEIEGNIMSLINSTDFSTLTTLESNFTFAFLFSNCTGLTSAENLILPATRLAMGCYFNMFNGCTSLTTAPALPATTLTSNCYQNMFNGCTSLTTAPALPATTLATYCYQNMFQGCTSLTTAPALPATTLAEYCYSSMFSDCTGLTTAPALPATTLANYCYEYMFDGCTSLTTAPSVLPATTLAQSCYANMFQNCTSLTTAPALPATTLASYCYENMFQGCTSLTTAPSVLPATTLADYCYAYMFNGCTSLTTAPELPAATLVDECYGGMFLGCSSLNYIKCLATDISATNCTYDWVSGVASTGTFAKASSMTSWTTGTRGIPTGWTVGDNREPLTFNILSAGTINWTASNSSVTKTIEYKLNDNEWTSITSNTGSSAPTITVNPGDKLQFRGNNAQYNDSSSGGYNSFSGSTALFEAEGNIMSLIYGDNFKNKLTINDYAFAGLFQECVNLISAKNLILPATTLTDSCYAAMFGNCTSLTTAPQLPATTLAHWCYYGMFLGCTSLTTVPELPATTLATECYYYMFGGCTSLTTAPSNLLPATTLADGCYSGMFTNCTSLTTAPALPATTLAEGCYGGMFYGCTNLNYIKCLATDISASNCTGSWVDGVASTGTFVKNPNMASWTTGVNGIPANWTVENNQEPLTFNILSAGTINWKASNTSITRTIDYKLNNGEWVSITSNTGSSAPKINVAEGDKIQFRGNNAQYTTGYSAYNSFGGSALFEVEGNIMSLIYGDDFKNNLTISSDYAFVNLFIDCINLVSAENLVLPATTLAQYCYDSMFQNCTSLTTAPELPATTLASHCYANMFQNCTKLTTAPELPATNLANYCYSSMFSNCTSLTTAPALPATTLATSCYQQMFNNCTSLTTAPELPATDLADSCYYSMFYGTNVLPDCSNIDFASSTVVASGGLKGLFYGTKVTDNDLERLLPKNDNGRYYLPATTLATSCYSSMFSNCTSLTTAPELPATTLASNCYSSMFVGCTSLTTAPELPATSLARGCYQFMFRNCTSLNYIKCLATDISATNCTSSWVYGVASTGTFVKNLNMTSWTTGTSGIPTGWTVQDA